MLLKKMIKRFGLINEVQTETHPLMVLHFFILVGKGWPAVQDRLQEY